MPSDNKPRARHRSEEHTSELQSQSNLVCRLLLEKKTKVNILSVAEGLTNQVAESIHEANLSCQVLDGGSFMLARSVELMNDGIFFFFNDAATTEIYTLSLHDALPI